MKYTLSFRHRNQQYIDFQWELSVEKGKTELKLPTWRPGRYELGNFAKNIRNFTVTDLNGRVITAAKTSHSVWLVDVDEPTSIVVNYQFYAATLNAGSTLLDDQQLYVNPVNCFFYTDARRYDHLEVILPLEEGEKVACSLPLENGCLMAESFDELVDAPFVVSKTLLHHEFECVGIKFHLWFQGLSDAPWDKIESDFKKFTEAQIKAFTEFPVSEYHYITQVVPYKAYHGVEHHASTVLFLGPTYAVFKDLYTEFLGVSSHELYHTWNVKAIRTADMWPYNFDQENYSRMGYLCEGVTTYQGDLMLYKSGVFDFDQYAIEFNRQLQRHFDNQARFHTTLGDSSFDTWLDGYQLGAPGRKLSIYTEGCLVAFLTDIRLRKLTTNKYGLDELMKRLYFDFALKNKGVTEEAYKAELQNISGDSWDNFFEDFVHGKVGLEGPLSDALDYLGLDLLHKPSSVRSHAVLGVKTLPENQQVRVKAIYPGSPSDMGGVQLEDLIVAVNGNQLQNDFDHWVDYFANETQVLTVFRSGRMLNITMPLMNRTFFNEYSIAPLQERSKSQENAFIHWSKS